MQISTLIILEVLFTEYCFTHAKTKSNSMQFVQIVEQAHPHDPPGASWTPMNLTTDV